MQPPFLIFKESTSVLLVHLLINFLFSTNQILFDFFLQGREKRIKRKQSSEEGSLQPSAAHGMLYSLLIYIFSQA